MGRWLLGLAELGMMYHNYNSDLIAGQQPKVQVAVYSLGERWRYDQNDNSDFEGEQERLKACV